MTDKGRWFVVRAEEAKQRKKEDYEWFDAQPIPCREEEWARDGCSTAMLAKRKAEELCGESRADEQPTQKHSSDDLDDCLSLIVLSIVFIFFIYRLI